MINILKKKKENKYYLKFKILEIGDYWLVVLVVTGNWELTTIVVVGRKRKSEFL